MGFGLPAAIGVKCAFPDKQVVDIAGDGSIQMNLQELETLVHYELPVKVFVFNNGGYLSMRLTQDNLFAGARFGESSASGVGLPNMLAVANAYGIAANRVDSHAALSAAIADTLAADGPSLLDVVMDPEQGFAPKVIAEKRPDGTIVSPTNAAKAGETIRLYVTGIGWVLDSTRKQVQTNQPGYPGQLPWDVTTSVTLNNAGTSGVTAEYAENLIGVFVVSFQVPAQNASATIPIFVSATPLGQQTINSLVSHIPVSQ